MFEKVIKKLKPKSRSDHEIIEKITEIEVFLREDDGFYHCLKKINELLLQIESCETGEMCDDEFNLSELHSKLVFLRLFFGYENVVFYEKAHKHYNADIILKTFFINKLSSHQIFLIFKMHNDYSLFFKEEADFRGFLRVYKNNIIKLMQGLEDVIFFQKSRYFELLSRDEQIQFISSIDQVIQEEIATVPHNKLFEYGVQHIKAAIRIFKDNKYRLMDAKKAMQLIIKYRADFELLNIVNHPHKNIVYLLAKKCPEAALLILENEKKYRSSLLTTQEFENVIASHKNDKKFIEFLIKNYKSLCSKYLLFKLDEKGFLDFIARCSQEPKNNIPLKKANILSSPLAFFNSQTTHPSPKRENKGVKAYQRKNCCTLM